MTEKEIAKKVWKLLDDELKLWRERTKTHEGAFSQGGKEALLSVSELMIHILPRPKKKVKKEMWVNIYQDDDNESYLVSPLHDNEDEAQHASKGDDAFIDRVTVTFEVESDE